MESWRVVLIREWDRTRKTLDELADQSKLNRGTVHRILDNKTKDPGVNSVEKLATAFGFTMIDLYTRAATIEPRPKKDDDGATNGEQTGGDPRLADRLGESYKGIFSAIDAVPLSERGKFVSSVIAVLTSMEHAISAANDGPNEDARS